jgi:predicted GNAT family acetyltransferase
VEVELRDNARDHRYEGVVDGAVAGYVRYHERPRDGAVVLLHTEVDPSFEGKGVGSALAKLTLDSLRARGAKIVPSCPFVAAYIQRHPEYDDLVAA